MKLGIARPVSDHRSVVHGGIYPAGKGLAPNLLDFSSNVNPLGVPPSVRKGVKDASRLYSTYPDSDSALLRKKLEGYTEVPSDCITVGSGATEIIYNFCKAFLSKSAVLIPVPTFGEYEAAARLNGARISRFRTMDLNRDLDGLIRKIRGARCVFVCNPNNPTGVLASRKTMLEIVNAARERSALVFVDECFIELSSRPEESMVPSLSKFDNLFILRSMTKSFGLAGLRVGYGLGSRKMVEILNRIKIPWNVSGVAQELATKALADKRHLARTRKLVERERTFLKHSISKITKFHCYGSDANFLLIGSTVRSDLIQKKLAKRGILVRDCSSFAGLGDRFIRIAVRSHRENIRLVREMGNL